MTGKHPHLSLMEKIPLHEFLGLKVKSVGNGCAEIEIEVSPELANPTGALHGGVIYSMCDVVCYIALIHELNPDELAATHDIHFSIMRAAMIGDRISFRGQIVKRGKNIAFLEAKALSGDQVIATGRVTKSIMKMPKTK